MKLQDSLYAIVSDTATDKGYDYKVELYPDHVIYQAHFPGQPITPGVCIIQIAKELLEQATSQLLQIVSVKNVKFLRVISPIENRQIIYSLTHIEAEGELTKVQVNVSVEDELYAKLSFTCQKA